MIQSLLKLKLGWNDAEKVKQAIYIFLLISILSLSSILINIMS